MKSESEPAEVKADHSGPKKGFGWRRLIQNLALAFASFILCFLLGEVILRLCGFGNLEIYQPDPVLYWRLKPNQQCYTKVGHQPVHVNSLGTRGPEFNPAKPPGVFRILSLGDSRTFGWGLAETETYSTRLAAAIQARLGNSKAVEVINAGVNAWSYSQMYVYYRDVAQAYSPDVVIVGEANLWTQFSERNSPEFIRKFMNRVRLKNLLRRSALYHYLIELKLKSVYERYRTKFIPVDPAHDTLFPEQQQADPDAQFRTAIESILELAATNHARSVLLHMPTLDEADGSNTNLSRSLKVKQELSSRRGVPLVDVTKDLLPNPRALYLDADPVHLNARGNEIIARDLTSAVAAALSP